MTFLKRLKFSRYHSFDLSAIDPWLYYCHSVKHKYFDKIRYHVDKLELFVDDEDWPLVKFREMLFVH